MSKAVHAVRWNIIASMLRALILVFQVFALARILDKETYGTAAIVLTIVNFARVISDFGISSAIIQAPSDLTFHQKSSLYWLNIGIYLLVSCLVFLLAVPIGHFMRNPDLVLLTRASSLIFFVSGFGVQFLAEAERRLNFGPVSQIEILSLVIGLVVTLGSASAGLGAMCVVWGGVASGLSMSVLLWAWPGQRWIPSLRFRLGEVTDFIKFGAVLFFSNVINQLAGSVDMFVGPRYIPARMIGAYALPRQMILQLQRVINPVVTRVALPLFAQSADNVSAVRRQFHQMLAQVSYVNAPLYAAICAFAPDIIRILAGPGWDSSAEALQILAIRGLTRTLIQPAGSLIIGLGRKKMTMYWNVAQVAVTLVGVVAFSPFGLIGLTIGVTLSSAVMIIPCWYFLVRPLCAMPLPAYLDASLRSSLIAFPVLYVAHLAGNLCESPIARILVGGLVASTLYLVLSQIANAQAQRKLFRVLGLTEKALIKGGEPA